MYQLMLALAGPAVWAVHFFSMYAAQTLACAGVFDIANYRLAAGLLTALAVCALLAAMGYPVLASRGPQRSAAGPSRDFLPKLQIMLAGLALLAVAWGIFPAFALPAMGCV